MSNTPNVFVGDEQQIARKWLVDHLKYGPVEVVFTKKDGSERAMKCTLQENVVMPYEKKTDKEKHKSDDTLSVWDVEKSAWRSFRWDAIKSVNFTVGGQ